MKGVYLIFDYFKEAYDVNRTNKALYKPQIALILIKLFMIIGTGIVIYSWVNDPELQNYIYQYPKEEEILRVLLIVGGGTMGMVFIYILASRIVEAGLYNMYKQCVVTGKVEPGAFTEGVSKYFFRFLGGDFLIFLAWIPFSIVYIIAGVLTMSIGFAIIPMVISIFLTMWKVSMVMNNCGLFYAIKDSIKYAKKHFIPLSFLQLIHWSFTKSIQGSSGGSGNIGNVFDLMGELGNLPQTPATDAISSQPNLISNSNMDFEKIISIIKIVIAIFIPVITIATAVAALINMIFEVFFSLLLFVAYKNGFEESKHLVEGEVLS